MKLCDLIDKLESWRHLSCTINRIAGRLTNEMRPLRRQPDTHAVPPSIGLRIRATDELALQTGPGYADRSHQQWRN